MAKAIPDGIHSITPSMTIDGAAEAIELYKRAFGAVEVNRAPDPTGTKIMHAEIRIGNSAVFLNDVFVEMGATAHKTRLWFYSDGVDAAWKRAVDAGLSVRMPLADMFWGDRLGVLTDRWGNDWHLAQHVKDMTPEEMMKAQEAFFKK